jgi:hypothetical protein
MMSEVMHQVIEDLKSDSAEDSDEDDSVSATEDQRSP